MLKKKRKINKIVSIVIAIAMLLAAMVVDLPNGSSEVKAASTPWLTFRVHVENRGWYGDHCTAALYPQQDYVFGTVGQALRIEAIQMGVDRGDYTGEIHLMVRYFDNTTCTITKEITGTDRRESMFMSGVCGTTGISKPIEAVKIWFTGEFNQHYGVKYAAHCQNDGWHGITYQGGWAGTRGRDLRLEAIHLYFFVR